MVVNEALTTIVRQTLNRHLESAIEHLECFLCSFSLPYASESLYEIKADYQRMTEYWLQGCEDSQREEVYNHLLRRMYNLIMNVAIHHYIRNSNYVSSVYNQCRNTRKEWTSLTLKQELEEYVSEIALVGLEPLHIAKSKKRELYDRHLQMMSDLFDYIWTSRFWKDNELSAFEDVILSPTIDVADQQLLISAITLSLLNFFDYYKFCLLVNVYMKSADEGVRQRSLVGWVLCLNDNVLQLYPDVRELVNRVADSEQCSNELIELQMQMIYCLRAESDTHIIKNEIMPELMKSSNIRMTNKGIEEVDEDPMEDVLHPELSEERMKKLEESLQRMTDMQKQGSDVYFGGFSQMKRFSFFNKAYNWFLPFAMQHPVVEDVISTTRGRRFLSLMMSKAPFCDSDKYSFILGYKMSVEHLPESILQLLDRGEATIVGSDVDPEELKTPAFIRRSYLQNLYRFYRVYPWRNEFVNPFDVTDSPRYLFVANSLFQNTKLENHFNEIVGFFVKQKLYDAAKKTLRNYRKEIRGEVFFMLNGIVLQRCHDEENAGFTASECFSKVLEMNPDNTKAWIGYARSMFEIGEYQKSFEYYQKLADIYEGNTKYELNMAVCLSNMKDYDNALRLLYKLNYNASDNVNIKRALAWTLMNAKKYEQAVKLYQELLKEKEVEMDDVLNAAYLFWFIGNRREAISLFKQYVQSKGTGFNVEKELFKKEAAMIENHGLSDIEVCLMTDQLS